MRPGFFKLTLWNDPQKGAKRPAERSGARAMERTEGVSLAGARETPTFHRPGRARVSDGL